MFLQQIKEFIGNGLPAFDGWLALLKLDAVPKDGDLVDPFENCITFGFGESKGTLTELPDVIDSARFWWTDAFFCFSQHELEPCRNVTEPLQVELDGFNSLGWVLLQIQQD